MKSDMFWTTIFCILFSIQCCKMSFNDEQDNIINKLNKVLDFALLHAEEINFDGALGLIIAEGKRKI